MADPPNRELGPDSCISQVKRHDVCEAHAHHRKIPHTTSSGRIFKKSRRSDLFILSQERPHLTGEGRQVPFDDTPDYLVRYGCVSVNQAISECNDQGRIGDLLPEGRFPPEELVQRFTDDLKLPLNGDLSMGSLQYSSKVLPAVNCAV